MIKTYDWWEMVPSASALLEAIALQLKLDQKSTVLLLPPDVPWYSIMLEKLEMMLDDSDRKFERLECPEDVQPGALILDTFFKDEVKIKYMPTKGYEKLIAENDSESRFKNAIVFLQAKSPQQLEEWTKFVSGYEKEKRSSTLPHGMFILEYRGDTLPKLSHSLPTVKWSEYIHDYDKHIYAMLSVSYVKESQQVLEYLSEFISLLSGNDVELASELAKHGIACISEPQKVFEKINSEALRSDDSQYDISINEKKLDSVFWQAQVKVLFPQIEKFKNKIILENKDAFDGDIKFVTVYGKEKNDYQELEIGELLHLHSIGKIQLSKELENKGQTFKKVRNSLAHFTPIAFEDALKVLNEKL